jgi:hypothetical protein
LSESLDRVKRIASRRVERVIVEVMGLGTPNDADGGREANNEAK